MSDQSKTSNAEPRAFAQPLATIGVAFGSFAAEWLAMRIFLDDPRNWILALAVHVGTLGGIVAWYRFGGVRTDARVALLLIGFTLTLGPAGAPLTLIIMGLSHQLMKKSTSFEDWYRTLFPELSHDAINDLARRVAKANLDDPSSLTPFSEVLTFGSLHQKQAMIAAISQAFQPAFGPILKRALIDENNAVRVQAATAMNRIENEMHAKTVDLTHRLEQSPDNPDRLLALGRHFDEYLFSGVLDTRRDADIRERALAIWTRYLELRPDDTGAAIAANRLRLRSGRYDEASESLAKIIESGVATPQVRLWFMEALYRRGRYEDLRRYAGQRESATGEEEHVAPAAREALDLWAGRQPALSGTES